MVQAQLAASTSALAALRAELAEANHGWTATRKELADRMQELNERTQEVASLRAALIELRLKAASSRSACHATPFLRISFQIERYKWLWPSSVIVWLLLNTRGFHETEISQRCMMTHEEGIGWSLSRHF